MLLRLAELIWETGAEGPGLRTALWVQGCPLRCAGCCNPELWSRRGGRLWEPADLARLVIERAGGRVEGLTLLGGEPFAQAEACAEFAEGCHRAGLSVMVFSGYTLAELEGAGSAAQRLLASCDLLVDGPYERALPEGQRPWIGSSNQKLHFLSERYDPGDPRFHGPNTIELRLAGGALLINGWPTGCDEVLA